MDASWKRRNELVVVPIRSKVCGASSPECLLARAREGQDALDLLDDVTPQASAPVQPDEEMAEDVIEVSPMFGMVSQEGIDLQLITSLSLQSKA